MNKEKVYIGKIRNDILDVKTLVIAKNETEAKDRVKLKFIKDLNKFYCEEEIQICLFSDNY